MKREILAIALFLTSLLPFNYFIPLSLILLGFISLQREWKILPVVSILTFIASFFFDYTKENAVLLTLLLPLTLISVKYDKLISSIFFSLSIAFLPFGTEKYIILLLTSILLIGINYKGTIISGISLLIISALGYQSHFTYLSQYSTQYANLAYFYLIFGIIATILQGRITIKKEYYLSLGSVLFPLLYHYTIPSIILSIGFGMFFPFSIILSGIMFFSEGVKYGLFLIPTIILPYVLKRWKNTLIFSTLSVGISWFSAIIPPLLLFLFPIWKIEKRSILISSFLLVLTSVYLIFSGNYNIFFYSAIASIISSSVFISSRFIYNVFKKIHNIQRLILFSIIGIVAISSILSFEFYDYSFTYVAFIASSIYFSYIMYKEKSLQFFLLVIVSLLSRYPFIPLSGYRLKDKTNIIVMILAIAIAIFYMNLDYSLIALSSSLAYLIQNFRITKIFSYIPPITIFFPLDLVSSTLLTRILFSAIVVISGYLIGRKWEFLGLIYEISLAFSFLYIIKLI